MKTPQEKKNLSYAKDRRNTYGANNKASRKSIPLAKARINRANRHLQDALLSQAVNAKTEDELTLTEIEVKSAKGGEQWTKCPDEPLGVVLAKKSLRKKRLGYA
jgi:hypothetical protein